MSRRTRSAGRKSAIILAAASAPAQFANSAWAANNTFTFTAGGTSWSNPTAWLFGNPYPNGVNEVANFTAVDLAPIAPIQYPITLDLNVTLGTLAFGDTATATPGGWILVPGGTSTLTMDTGNTLQPTITVNALGNNPAVSFVDMQVQIFGTNGFIKNGAGMLRLNASNGFAGSINVNAGTLEVGNNLNLGTNSSSVIQLSGGTLSLRSDTPFDLRSRTLLVTANSALNVDRSAVNTTSTVSGITDHVGTISMGTGSRSLTVTGNNFFGVTVGTLVLDPTNSAALISDLAPGQLTISNVIGGSSTTASTISFAGTGTNSTGSSLSITNAITQSSAAGTLSVLYSDTHTLTVGSFVSLTGNLILSGNGTLIVQSGKLPSGSLGVQTGTLDFSTTNQDSTVTHLSLGGINNASGGYINSGAGGTLSVTGNVTFSSSVNGLGSTIDGKLNLGGGLHSLQINGIGNIPTQEVTVNAITNGTGTLVKGGTGQILLTAANALSTAVVINQGTFSGAARAFGTGNALTSGAVTISGGILRLVNQTASAGTGSIGSLDFNGAATNPAILVIDSGSSNATTSLKIGTFLGRVAGTTGALTIIPRNGGLDSTEAIYAGSIAAAVGPGLNHGILAPYVAAQASASNTSIDFLGITGSGPFRIGGGGAAYKTDNINNYTAGTAVFFANNVTADITTTGRSLFALKADGTLANVSGNTQTLTLGDGTLAGLIVNNGANVSVSNLVVNAPEAIFWAGGRVLDVDGTTVLSAGGTISSNISFAQANSGLTTSGSETITLSGGLNLGGVSRQITVSNGTAVMSGNLSNGNLTKGGPSYLYLNGNNTGYNGMIRVDSGTVQLGQGILTPLASIANASVTIGNGNFVINLNGTQTLNNNIVNASGGTGALIVDSPSGVLSFANGTSSFSSLTIQSGNVRLTNNNQIPNAATLTVQGTGSFDMNGFSQTIGSLAGTTGTGIVTNTGGLPSTLTLNVNNTLSPTFAGQITNGVGGIAVDKRGTGTQVLSGPSSYAGGTRILAGTLSVGTNTSAGTGSIQFAGPGAALALANNVTVANVVSIGSSTGTVGAVNGATGTLSGVVNVSGGTLAISTAGTIALLQPALAPANFNGTISQKGGGTLRVPNTTDASGAVFDLSTQSGTLLLNNTTTIGFIQGATSTGTITGGSLNIGSAGGTSTYGGTIGSVINKIGEGTFIVSSSTPRNHPITRINTRGGALVFGQNANLSGNIVINIGTYTQLISSGGEIAGNGGDLYFAGNANFTGTATVVLTDLGKWDLTQVPGGYNSAGGLTLQGSGNVLGSWNHAAGTLMPGGSAKGGTISFNNPANPGPLTMGNGRVQLDFAAPDNPGTGTIENLGGAVNDLIVANGDVNLNPSTIYRFNYIGLGTVNSGDDFPFMYYTGNKTGWGAGSISTTSGQVRSAFRADFSLKELGSPGSGVIAAHANNVGGSAQVLTWTGSQNGNWDLNLSMNFRDSLGNATTFFQGDTVIFDNTAVNRPTISIEQAVFLPATVIVNNGSNAAGLLSLGGPGSPALTSGLGTLAGNMKLIKKNTGQLNLNSYNAFIGGVELNQGTLNLNNGSWIENYYDHPQSGAAGFGTITFTSTVGDATVTNGGNTIANNVRIPAGMYGNIRGNNVFLLGPISGDGTLQLWGSLLTYRTGMDDFHGTVIVNGPLNADTPKMFGTDVNWVWAVPGTINTTYWYGNGGADGVAVDISLGQLNGPANFAAGSGRRYGNLHIGGSNVDSFWTGNSANNANGPVLGYMAVTKEGTGSLVMTGSHGYTGPTTVNNGVLQLSNSGGVGGTSLPGFGVMTGTRQLLVRGGTFRLGAPGGGVLAGNAGTITTATTGLLMSVDSGGTIDVSNAYDADALIDPDDQSVIDYQAFGTAAGVTWAGNGGNVKGVIRHQAGTISPGRDSGEGSFGSVNFVDALELRGGAVMVDIGSNTSAHDTVLANTLDVGGGTVIVNAVGGSAAANSVYTIMSGSNFFGSVNSFQGLIVKGRGASGTLQQGGPSGHDVQLKILTPGTTASITWAGANGGSWDVRSSQSWLNSTNTPDFFYHGDTVTFGDSGSGSIALAGNLMPGGEVRVNNTGTNTWSFGGKGGIGGTASLHKMGTGTLKLIGTHTYSGGTTIDTGGTLVLGNDNIYTATAATNNALQDANPGGQAGTGSIVNNGVLVVAGAGANILKNNISGTGGVYFRDVGGVRLDGTNTWLGGTTISSSGIGLGRDNALPTGTLNFVNRRDDGDGTFNLQRPRLDMRTYSQTILELNSFGTGIDSIIYTSEVGTNSISTLTIGRTGPGGFIGTIRQNRDGDHSSSAMVAVTKMSDGTPGGGIATINSSAIGITASNYCYGGLTSINAGTFIFIGEHWPATTPTHPEIARENGTYTIASGAALGGDYTINTHVDVQAGGRLAPGWQGATSSHTAEQIFLNLTSADLYFGVYGFDNDLINVVDDNALVVNGVSQIHLNGALAHAGTFTLMDYNGAVITDMLAKVQLQSSNITNPGTFNYALLNNTVNTSLDLVITQPIVQATWQVDLSSSWSGGQNWTTNPTTPNAFGSTANFDNITTARTVTMDGPFSLGTANFTSAAPFTIVGSNATTLTFGNVAIGGAVGINVTQGSHAINVPLAWNNDGTFNIAAGATLTVGGGFGLYAIDGFTGHNVTKVGAGTLKIDSIRSTFGNDGSSLFRVSQGTVQMLHHATANTNSSKVNSLAIDNGAKLDLTNNSMVIDYTSLIGAGTLLTQIQGWLKSTDGRLYSSDADATHGIGYKDNVDPSGAGNKLVSNFGGVTVDVTSILLRYTYLGDTNVDGQVDLTDLYNVASNYNPTHAGAGTAVWQKGDFDYNGYVDLADLTKIATNWQAGVGNPLGSGLGGDLGPLLTSLGLPNIAVPEPTTLSLIGLGLTGLAARRRRRA